MIIEIHVNDRDKAMSLLIRSGYRVTLHDDSYDVNIEQLKLLKKAGIRLSEKR
ncbi:hypothetical protein LCGC14_1620500 [marine sediment metagenome]|uniref:Uncharacterized protein n=1 Tax=marine sediment metagenome TaxID=412755 RepID=A0A0F9KL72_9ZZZZ